MILIVKSPFALLTSLATLMALSACGQTGPLYMPKPPARIPAANTNAVATGPTNTSGTNSAAVQIAPPAPAAGVTVPAAGSNANNTQAPNQPAPATQQ